MPTNHLARGMTVHTSLFPGVETGRILHVQRLSTEDGPGIRTTVFFKGCPLRCQWCHNPESISLDPQIQWLEDRCISCHTCLSTCSRDCLSRADGGLLIDRLGCDGCGICAYACPTNALELLGTTVHAADLAQEARKDRAFYETSGGGVTASGGEPAMQPGFVAHFLALIRASGISTALDTCGFASRQSLDRILPHADLIMFDLKEIENRKHQAFTGQSNELILRNLLHVRNTVVDAEGTTRLWIRTPLIPGATATSENLAGLGSFIAQNLDGLVDRWELCAFNNLCHDKYRRLDMAWRYKDTPLLTVDELHAFESEAKRSGVDPAIVVATGATRDG